MQIGPGVRIECIESEALGDDEGLGADLVPEHV